MSASDDYDLAMPDPKQDDGPVGVDTFSKLLRLL